MSRSVQCLPPARAHLLEEQPFTYAPVGGTRAAPYPSGFHVLEETYIVGRGRAAFDAATELLMTWQMHTRAGLRVAASSHRVRQGAVVLCRLGPLRIPCRVVWVREEPGLAGFGYGTLAGHPVSGEESFVLRLDGDIVRFTVTAYARPAGTTARLAGPAGRLAQRLAARRYANALRR